MTTTTGKGTRTELVYDALRADLMNAKLEQGSRLKLTALVERFGVSQSVIREALTRLSEQGLVIAEPQRGFSVRPLTREDLADLTNVRVHLEGLALRESMTQGDVAWESRVVSTHYQLERLNMVDENGFLDQEWTRVHAEFHHALVSECGSDRLLAIVAGLRESSDLYRQWSWSMAQDFKRDYVAEHRNLMDLTLARKADEAVEAMKIHIERASNALMKFLDTVEEPDKADSRSRGSGAQSGRRTM
jgi:DNA-binding GntR family transcriptional regulator